MTGPQADAALFFFYRKERGNESDQGETAEKNVTYIILKELFRKRGYANEGN